MISTENPLRGNVEHKQTGVQSEAQDEGVTPIALPEIPTADLSFDFFSITGAPSPEEEKQKRESNVMKLEQEKKILEAELKSMTDRLEVAERRREELAKKELTIMEEPSS